MERTTGGAAAFWVAWRAGLREQARNRDAVTAWEHGATLARKYGARHARNPAEYARIVLSYGEAFLDAAFQSRRDEPECW
jgi:hypothetical protein